MVMHLYALITIGIILCGIVSIQKNIKNIPIKNWFSVLLFVGIICRILIAWVCIGYENDLQIFSYWGERVVNEGFRNFYHPDVFADYPPGYIYVLGLLEHIRRLFNITMNTLPHYFILKLPAIVCDIISAIYIFKIAKEKNVENIGLFVSLMYLLNPTIIFNSSVWGQIDSVYGLFLIVICYYLMIDKYWISYIAFGLGIIVKPQVLFMGPILLVALIKKVYNKQLNVNLLLKQISQCIAVIVGCIIIVLPFGLQKTIEQYFNTVTSYPYASVNAYNFWSMLGLNWVEQNNTLFGIQYQTWGTIFLALGVIIVLYIGLKSKTTNYPMLGALMVTLIFTFSVRMHERYLYPVLVLMLIGYLFTQAKSILHCYVIFSVLHFYNIYDVLFNYATGNNYDTKSSLVIIVSALTVGCAIYFIYVNYQIAFNKESLFKLKVTCEHHFDVNSFWIKKPIASARTIKIVKKDWILILLITIIYGAIAYYDLGDMDAPTSTYSFYMGDVIDLRFDTPPTTMQYYIAPWEDKEVTISSTEDDIEWLDIHSFNFESVFTWHTVEFLNIRNHIRLTMIDGATDIIELAFYDKNGEKILPINASEYETLFDEQELVPYESTYKNGMYFDEVYHGRTAYEYINHLYSYENTHPPLGKIFISIGILLFGMNPFGWRCVGVLFGILMLPFIYFFAKKISNSTLISSCTTVIMAFDFMHFVQTRISTIDVYITFFVILMYYFMYQYTKLSFYDTELKKTFKPLLFCGLSMGLGIACKWTGVYAAIGLALLFFAVMFRRFCEYNYAKLYPNDNTNGIEHSYIIENYPLYFQQTIAFCVIVFIVMPFVIYTLSYIPFNDSSTNGLITRMFDNQFTMFNYHSTLESTHPYSSPWYTWPIIKRPVWYYSYTNGDMRGGISAFGNPLVWWIGIPILLYMLYLGIRKQDFNAKFLLIGYFAEYVPWFFVSRCTFMYHYFPSVPFVVLMIMYAFVKLKEKVSKKIFISSIIIYTCLVVGLFILFYPVLSGHLILADFVEKYLRWFESWVLCA